MSLKKKIDLIISDIREGTPIIVVDSYDRENEGDLMIAAEKATPETLAFIAKNARGIMCIPTAKSILDRLQIPMSPSNNNDKFSTPFAVSIDARHGISTGVSVDDRMETIRLVLDENTTPDQLAYPGHLFPLRPRSGLLKERQGHTEASIQLCLMAGMKPVAVISEVMNNDGSMARLPELMQYSREWEFQIISIDEIAEYCKQIDWESPINIG